jgi:preprotein translocase subunit SecY
MFCLQQQNYGENLKRVGAQIPGVNRGPATQKYLTKVQRRITLPGALFLGLVAIMPFLLQLLVPATAGAQASSWSHQPVCSSSSVWCAIPS